MPIRLHKKEERPEPETVQPERQRVSKTRGFPRFILWLLLAVIVAVGAWYAVTWNKIQVRGIVIAEFHHFVPEAPCRIVEVNAAVGKSVKAGDVLVVSQSVDPRSQIPTYEAALKQAERRLMLATAGGDVGVVDMTKRSRRLADARQALGVAGARLQAAQKSEEEYTELVKAVEADRAKEIEKATVDKKTATEKLAQARAAEKEVAVELAQAQLNLDKAKTLYELDAATLNDVQLARTKYDFTLATAEKAKSATAEAEKTLGGIEEVLRAVVAKYDAELEAQRARQKRAQAETDVARAFLEAARQKLQDAEKEYGELQPAYEKMRDAEVDYLKEQVEEAKGNLAYYKALAGSIVFKSPFDGIVSELNKQVGDVARRDEKVISVYNPKTVAVEAYIPEDKYYRVAVGQKAEVVLRGTKRRFTGKIVSVNTSPERLPGLMKVPVLPERAHDLYYYARISVPSAGAGEIGPAMRTDVTIYVR